MIAHECVSATLDAVDAVDTVPGCTSATLGMRVKAFSGSCGERVELLMEKREKVLLKREAALPLSVEKPEERRVLAE